MELFTSVPVDPGLNIIQGLLKQDTSLHDRTVLAVQNIIEFLGFCLHNTYFFHQSQFHEQVKGAGMGPPVSTIVANLYMEHFERKALSTATNPRLWMRYVDDTFVIQQEGHKHTFLEHINKVDPAIKFTVEGNQENRAIPFLDILVKPEADNTLSRIVYRKPTHTDQYLQWNSYYNLAAKYSVLSTLTHIARTVCIKPKLLNNETQHLRKSMTKCKYPKWALDKVEENSSIEARKIVMWETSRENLVKNTVTTPAVTLLGGTLPRINTTRSI